MPKKGEKLTEEQKLRRNLKAMLTCINECEIFGMCKEIGGKQREEVKSRIEEMLETGVYDYAFMNEIVDTMEAEKIMKGEKVKKEKQLPRMTWYKEQ